MDCSKMNTNNSPFLENQNSVSVVVPIYNEQENIDLLYDELIAAMESQPRPFDLILVDDGSRDGTAEQLQQLARKDRRVKLVLFRRNYGQTAAMFAGIQNATGDFIVTIDGDLQNDPRDIPMMLDKLEEGFDLVHGWRKNRQDHMVSRKIPSKIANWLISRTTRFPIHDLGCTLKAIRREPPIWRDKVWHLPYNARRVGFADGQIYVGLLCQPNEIVWQVGNVRWRWRSDRLPRHWANENFLWDRHDWQPAVADGSNLSHPHLIRFVNASTSTKKFMRAMTKSFRQFYRFEKRRRMSAEFQQRSEPQCF